MSFDGPWPDEGGAGSGPGGASEGIYAGGRIIVVDPSHPDVQGPAGTNVALPFPGIQQAINAAVLSGADALDRRTILIAPKAGAGYVEDIACATGVSLVGSDSPTRSGNNDAPVVADGVHSVLIDGTVTVDLVGGDASVGLGLQGLRVSPTGAGKRALYVTGADPFKLDVTNCAFRGSTAPGMEVDNAGVDTRVNLNGVVITRDSGDDAYVQSSAEVFAFGSTIRAADQIVDRAISVLGGQLQLLDVSIVYGRVVLSPGALVILGFSAIDTQTSVAVDVGAGAFFFTIQGVIVSSVTPSVIGDGFFVNGGCQFLGFGAGAEGGLADTLAAPPSFVAGLAQSFGVGRNRPPQSEFGWFSLKRHTGFVGAAGVHDSGVTKTTGAVTTTDDTLTSIPVRTAGNLTLDPSAVYWVKATIVGRERSGGADEMVVSEQRARVFRLGAGAATLGGASPSSVAYDSTNVALLGQIAVSGDDVLVQVQGLAGVTFDWVATVEFQRVGEP